ncbi:MAG: retroviral-like aspartic protease family protein [Granulosicoccus sp.]|nr:retroviral-like aspartic protease family protein [Granulosicoccus sp.]
MSDSKSDSPRDSARVIAGWMIALLWVLVLGGGTWLAQGWLDERRDARAPRTSSDEQGRQTLMLSADRYGQYQLVGGANQHTVNFLVDTGASGISIPQQVASRLQLQRGRPFQVMTANGSVRVYSTRLDSLSIGPFMQRDVRAHINPAMDGDTALLGMEFLRHYDLLQRDGVLTITRPQ